MPMVTVDVIKKVDTLQIDTNQVIKEIQDYISKKLPAKTVLVELVLTTPQEVLDLNLKYRQKDTTTDVLSFPIWPSKKAIWTIDQEINLGTIVINVDQVAKQASANYRTPTAECSFLCCHSIDHLLGKHHKE